MPLRNRVTPLGDLVAVPERGLVFGNRGCLHDAERRIRRRYASRRWIACRLQFRGRSRAPLMAPGRYTELFFLDDATAMAAGHRPCAECRRADYRRLTEIWSVLHPGERGADAIDLRLHGERIGDDGRPRLHADALAALPDGSFVLRDGGPFVVHGGELRRWSPGGYGERLPRATGDVVSVITPPSLVAVLRAGWSPAVPLLHPSVDG